MDFERYFVALCSASNAFLAASTRSGDALTNTLTRLDHSASKGSTSCCNEGVPFANL